MVEINVIKCQIIPSHPEFVATLAPDLYDRLDDDTVVLKENVRVILASKLPDEQDLMEKWAYLREKKGEKSNS